MNDWHETQVGHAMYTIECARKHGMPEVWKTVREIISGLLRRAKRAEAALAWQPISSAPRDGTLVLLYWKEGIVPDGEYSYEEWPGTINQCVGKWIGSHRGGNWVVPLIDAYFGVPSDPSCNLDFIEVDPTHWMPLPEPPEDAPR